MIIGDNKNNNNFGNDFNRKFNEIKTSYEKNKQNNSSDLTNIHSLNNASNKDEMLDKSFAMLQERYNNGTISLEEFTRQCNKINKLRQK